MSNLQELTAILQSSPDREAAVHRVALHYSITPEDAHRIIDAFVMFNQLLLSVLEPITEVDYHE